MDNDSLHKFAYRHRELFADLLRLAVPDLAEELALDAAQTISADQVGAGPAGLRQRHSDLTWRVPFKKGVLKDGTRPYLLVPLEFQSTVDGMVGNVRVRGTADVEIADPMVNLGLSPLRLRVFARPELRASLGATLEPGVLNSVEVAEFTTTLGRVVIPVGGIPIIRIEPEFVVGIFADARVGLRVAPSVSLLASAATGFQYRAGEGIQSMFGSTLRPTFDLAARAPDYDARAELSLDGRLNVNVVPVFPAAGGTAYSAVTPYVAAEKCRWGDYVDLYGGVRFSAGGSVSILANERFSGEVPFSDRRLWRDKLGLDANNVDRLFDGLLADLEPTVTAGVERLSITWEGLEEDGDAADCGITYNIYRDGRKIAGGLPSGGFEDEGLSVERSYSYQLSVNLPSGRESPRTAPVEGMLGGSCAVPEMVRIPGGTFTQGTPESEPFSYDDERPQRLVSVPAFEAGRYEVTFGEWDACVDAGGCGGHWPGDAGWGRGDRPVIGVSWQDAQRYVEWLSSCTGDRYRLLTESEWEYAARAGTTTPFHTGETITPSQANFDGTFDYPGDNRVNGLNRGQTVPVGSFAPNSFGLHDMHGNVREWVQDCWNGDYEGAPTDGSAWETGKCSSPVGRGGSWLNYSRYLRSAIRQGNIADLRSRNAGFRVARTLTP